MVLKIEKYGKILENVVKIFFLKVFLNNYLYEYNFGRIYLNIMYKLLKFI